MRSPSPAGTAETIRASYRYTVYGMAILSNVLLPELSTQPEDGAARGSPANTGGGAHPAGDAQILIRRARLGLEKKQTGSTALSFGPEAVEMWWREVGGFRISAGGALIEVDPASGVSDDLLAFPLLGPVLAMALHRRKMFLLHASAVSVDNAGIVLMGDKGAGKSTTATTLLLQGHKLIADDIAAFDATTGLLQPAFPQVKLSDEALSRLSADEVTVRPAVRADIVKHRVLIPDRFQPAPVRIARIYVLERGRETMIMRCDQAEALRHLLRFSYMARFGSRAMEKPEVARHFTQAAELANSGAVHRLVLPDGLGRLPVAMDRIREDVAAAGGAGA